jgi:hypothetical protein
VLRGAGSAISWWMTPINLRPPVGLAEGRGYPRPLPPLTMPASEAAAMEAASHAVAETTGVGETHTMTDITQAMAEAANMPEASRMAETAIAEMGDTYIVETHAVMGDRPVGAHAHVPEAMIGVTAKYSRVAVTIAVRIAVVIAKIIRTFIGAAVSRIVDGAGWASVLAGVGLGRSW